MSHRRPTNLWGLTETKAPEIINEDKLGTEE